MFTQIPSLDISEFTTICYYAARKDFGHVDNLGVCNDVMMSYMLCGGRHHMFTNIPSAKWFFEDCINASGIRKNPDAYTIHDIDDDNEPNILKPNNSFGAMLQYSPNYIVIFTDDNKKYIRDVINGGLSSKNGNYKIITFDSDGRYYIHNPYSAKLLDREVF